MKQERLELLKKELIVIDKIAIEDNLKVTYYIDDYQTLFGIDYTLSGEKVSLQENYEFVDKIHLHIESETELSSRELFDELNEKYRRLFMNSFERLFKTIEASIKPLDENLSYYYELNNEDLLFVYDKGEFKQLMLTNLEDKNYDLIIKTALFAESNLVTLKENKQQKRTLRLHEHNANTSTIISKDKKSILKVTSKPAIRSQLHKVPLTNPELSVLFLNKPFDETNEFSIFEKETAITVKCHASGKDILLSEFLDIPEDIIESDGHYFYKDAYKMWSLSNKYGCNISKKSFKNLSNFTYYNYNDNSELNLTKLADYSATLVQNYANVNNYSFRYPKKVYLNEDGSEKYYRDKLYMGIELEFDRTSLEEPSSRENLNEINHLFISGVTNYKPYMYSTHDSSLDYGFESKTVPTTIEALLNKDVFDFEKGFRILKDNDFKAGKANTCGYHIHLNKNFFTMAFDKYSLDDSDLDRLGLVVMSMLIENLWGKLVWFSRRTERNLSRWAPNRKIYENKKYVISQLKNKFNFNKTLDNFYATYKGHNNAVNNNKNATYEIRIFKGLMNRVGVLATAQLVHNLSHIVKQSMKDIVIAHDNGSEEAIETAFLKIFDVTFDDLVNYKQYDELNSYINNIEEYSE